MATPNRTLIVNDIIETLRGISEANDVGASGQKYKRSVACVERLAKTWAQTKPQVRPWIGVVAGREQWAYQPGACVRVTLRVTLIAHDVTDKADPDRRAESLGDLLDDIAASLNVDTRRGGAATMTTVKEVETDEAAPEGGISMVIGVDVVYQRTTGAT